ncbi:sn-glycerol-3-phosphate ABC transporter ATP-binding protein UgpC [Aestuariicella hydrocarbonica]|uniref:Sn-glycerol-3-phosphate ABC transporter ATP-binding protein UgpC n=1 Tax=Pseudomaricurvus hydrocarbonicus TaxID=1470433 RepID=A0A9E5T326_9GAMM|nr:sn-glycerol-3-phosphate ABC transporter ATP-binding protein UgpC [Aestuariicella hydrocarbonica]NHO68401.1 sn-glycerol-3-phosphate ABC transporter ATP-binding protein UgpC [Aestuariicella hydrocarbonica]
MSAISMQAVGKHFGKTDVINNISFDIYDGEFTVFVGPSGCGKSTLLRLIAGLEEVSSGNIVFDDEDVTEWTPAERGVAMVFQSYALYPHMNVYDNMAFGLKLAKKDPQSIRERVEKAAQTLQIGHLLDRKPRELSGGQRQRVAIGRAIVRQPRVFLFDEPLSNLDAALRVQTRLELKRLHADLGTTMIYVTHDQVEAMTLADRIVVLNDGRVEQIGSPLELYRSPCNLFVAGFIGSPKMNFLPGSVVERRGQAVLVDVGGGCSVTASVLDASGLGVGAQVTLGLRPEHLVGQASVSGRNSDAASNDGSNNDGGALAGQVIAVEHLGSEAYVHLAYDGAEPLVFKATGDTAIEVGQRIRVEVPAAVCYVFDETGTAVARPELT